MEVRVLYQKIQSDDLMPIMVDKDGKQKRVEVVMNPI